MGIEDPTTRLTRGALALATCLFFLLCFGTSAHAAAPGRATYVLDNLDGFDTCVMPSTAQMTAWWSSTNYYYVGLYLGGENYDGTGSGCTNSNVDASWVSTVGDQGWNFIPTWVGLQAPCSGLAHVMSSNTTTAYSQGVADADSAMNKSKSLGF
jgi:hypothetical protein